jgi:hypothetical protein
MKKEFDVFYVILGAIVVAALMLICTAIHLSCSPSVKSLYLGG